MKIWAKIIQHHRIVQDVVGEFASPRPSDGDGWHPILTELIKPLDIACPVLLNKHVAELARFGRTGFRASDFMESIWFDQLEVEIFPEKKKESTQEHCENMDWEDTYYG